MADAKVKKPRNCESCEFYDYDEELDAYVCDVRLDEDEMADFLGKNEDISVKTEHRCPEQH